MTRLQASRNRGFGHLVPRRFEIPREAVDGMERCRVVRQPVGRVGHRLGMRNIMAFNRIPKQDGVEIFPVGFDPRLRCRSGFPGGYGAKCLGVLTFRDLLLRSGKLNSQNHAKNG